MKNIFIFAIGLILFQSNLFAADLIQRQITVSGECNHMVTPDRGSITLTVEFQNRELSKATQDAANSYERLSSAIKKLNLKDFNMKTSEYTVNQVQEWENNKQVNKGFRARMGLWISTSEIGRVGEVIAAASKEKVKDVNSLQTYLSDDKQLQEEMSCLADAAKNARLKAEKLMQAMEAKLGPVMTVNETGRSMPSWPRPMMAKYATRAMSMEAADAAPSVEAGQQNLSLNIQVSFFIQ